MLLILKSSLENYAVSMEKFTEELKLVYLCIYIQAVEQFVTLPGK